MNKLPPTDFDLPTKHIGPESYVPPRTRSSTEAERRHWLPSGTLLLEQQASGLAIAHRMAELLEQPEDIDFLSRTLAAAGLNSAWYTYADHAPVMRRRLSLPTLADRDTEWRQTADGVRGETLQALEAAAQSADLLRGQHVERRVTRKQIVSTGRIMGNTALKVATFRLGDISQHVSAYDAQLVAREVALETLEASRQLVDELGVNISVAQLADPDSALSVFWRRNAPNGAYDAFEAATQE